MCHLSIRIKMKKIQSLDLLIPIITSTLNLESSDLQSIIPTENDQICETKLFQSEFCGLEDSYVMIASHRTFEQLKELNQ